ncbi:hypothetical protein EVAR_34721_1 [Eumeta japonica]|uniref:Uncharacterized protein n=1 Tax=Eumeta variegata TaxID=151549 RepID=A0A4C1XGA5_EUMVA|nr:hypothetical protein EVAR_34721_1 [Eumeta japonica]
MTPDIISLPPRWRFSGIYHYDENLLSDVVRSIRLMETVINAEKKKLLSDDINFKCQQNFTTFNAGREEILVHSGGVEYYDAHKGITIAFMISTSKSSIFHYKNKINLDMGWVEKVDEIN